MKYLVGINGKNKLKKQGCFSPKMRVFYICNFTSSPVGFKYFREKRGGQSWLFFLYKLRANFVQQKSNYF